ncbi:uncharacterized protein LOC135821029 [Sycon ciliatum]|uniref:uncharacterized protein LOC135821029 n=1 Tax=Sycon ciliatum TaxID=27933 RepID=UPI0031F60C0E
MAASVLRLAVGQCALVSGSVLAAAVAASVQRRCMSHSHAERKKLKHRFTGQVVVHGRNAAAQVHRCLEKLQNSQVLGVSFDYDSAGKITVIKLATPTAALLYPVSERDGLAEDVLDLLKSRHHLKVIYDGFDDVVQLEKRFGVKLEHFSDVYLDAEKLKKPDFPTMRELAQHCCNISLESGPILGTAVDYCSTSVGLPEMVKAAMQSWALTVLHSTFSREASEPHQLPVYLSPAQYFTESALLARARRSSRQFGSPIVEIGNVLARDCASSPQYRAGGGSDGGSGGSAGAAPRATSPSPQSSRHHHPGWYDLPLDNDGLLRLALWRLQRQPLTPLSLEYGSGDVNDDGGGGGGNQIMPGRVQWSGRGVRTDAVIRLPRLAVAFSTTSMLGTIDTNTAVPQSPTSSNNTRDTQTPPSDDLACVNRSLDTHAAVSSASPSSPASLSWHGFVKREVSRMKNKMCDFLSAYDAMSLTQPSCHGSVSVLTDRQILRLRSEAQSAQALHRSCMAAAPPGAPALLQGVTARQVPSLHSLVTEIEVARRMSGRPLHCHAPPPVANVQDILKQVPDMQLTGLQPMFRAPVLKSCGTPALDMVHVRSHFRQHYANLSEHLSQSPSLAMSTARDAAANPSVVRVMATVTSVSSVSL